MSKRVGLLILFAVLIMTVANVIPSMAQDGDEYNPQIDPENFVEGVDNPFFPLTPGTKYIYEGESDGETEHIETVILYETREVMGIECMVVRDTVWEDGELVEDTFDWYAQDIDGNVWYMGEAATDYEDGEAVSTEGSWEAGVDGALPGVIMWADPQVGEPYLQEYYEGEAEDMAQIVALDGMATVEYGEFEDLLVTLEWNPLEPGISENKYYADGIGLVLEEVAEGGEGRVELIDIVTDLSEDEIDDMYEEIGDSDDGDMDNMDDGEEEDQDDDDSDDVEDDD